MNKIQKAIIACFVGLLLMIAPAMAQEAAAPQECGQGCQKHMMAVTNFQANKACFSPANKAFVVIDSVDNTIDIRTHNKETKELDRVSYQVDGIAHRYDVKAIIRPVDVKVIDDTIIFLATSAKDSSYIGILDMQGNLLKTYGMKSHSNAFEVVSMPCGHTTVMVYGSNPEGYSIYTFKSEGDYTQMEVKEDLTTSYHRMRQSERIQESDPVGVGLTVIAILVVFLALVLVAVLIAFYSKIIRKSQDRKADKAAAAEAQKTGAAAPAHIKTGDVSGEVYAAIAAAIHLYNEELHDEESSIITIQKAERAWTPWNAKFYNMNQTNPKRK